MDLKRAVSSIEPDQLTILLSHNPDVIYYVDEESKVDLILSGHTHGGQIRLFNFGMYELGGLKEKRQIPLLLVMDMVQPPCLSVYKLEHKRIISL